MRQPLIQLALWIAAWALVAYILTPLNMAFAILGLIIVPAIFLAWVDLGRALRQAHLRTKSARLFSIIVALPQALFGLASLAAGFLVVLGFLLLPPSDGEDRWPVLIVVPLLVFFGLRWLREVFQRRVRKPNG